MREGSLDAPTRHPLDWQSEDFYNRSSLEKELERVFDICHGCRRCFNLCSSFPTLFDLIDNTASGELAEVSKQDYRKVTDGCTLCDMCFMTKCPYVPPHEFNLDFPHLMLRARAVEAKENARSFAETELTKTDRNGKIGCACSGVVNWASDQSNGLTRPVLEALAGVDKGAALPRYASQRLSQQVAKGGGLVLNTQAPAYGQKAVIFATCYGEYNTPEVGMALRQILAHNGVASEVVYPECCGMPQLEQGKLSEVAAKAERVSQILGKWIEDGYRIIAPVPSCALMMKQEWPLLLPDHHSIAHLAAHCHDVSEYLIYLKDKFGLAEGLQPLEGKVSLHIACHARAQNLGRKGEEIMRLIPELDLNVVERCSGHGGSWGIMKDNFAAGMKQARPVVKQMQAGEKPVRYIASECPLAGLHLAQGIEESRAKTSDSQPALPPPELLAHPLLLLAKSWGLS